MARQGKVCETIDFSQDAEHVSGKPTPVRGYVDVDINEAISIVRRLKNLLVSDRESKDDLKRRIGQLLKTPFNIVCVPGEFDAATRTHHTIVRCEVPQGLVDFVGALSTENDDAGVQNVGSI